MRLLRSLLFSLIFWPLAAAAEPADAPVHGRAWIMSVPHAQSADYLYKVKILDIDGAAQKELIRYAVAPGRHEVTVELMLDLEWEPDLLEGRRPAQVKRVVVEATAGKSYLLGGRVDPNAPAESQLDQSYWSPEVFELD